MYALSAFRGEKLLHCKSIREHLGDKLWNEFETGVADMVRSVSDEADGLLKQAAPGASIADRGTFLEVRMCTCNICVIGRTPSLAKSERGAFEVADKAVGLRARVLEELRQRFGPSTPFALNFSVGGQIGIDCAPCGWDKTFCLNFLPAEEFPTIHFFGDKTHEGGGDYELYEHPRTIGHAVVSAEDTLAQVQKLFLS